MMPMDIPHVPAVTSLRDALAWQAEHRGDAVALEFVSQGQTHTRSFLQIARSARALADGPLACLPCGARVILAVRPGPGFVQAFFGCQYAGLVGVPIGTARARDLRTKLADQCAAANAALILTDDTLAADVAIGAPDTPVVSIDGIDPASSSRAPNVAVSDLAYVQFTSGSTGAPKMVAIGQDNVIANITEITAGFGIRKSWSSVTWLPPHHDMGLISGVLLPIACGHRTTAMSPGDFARNPLGWLTMLSQTGAEVSGAPDFAYDLCARRLASRPDALDAETDLSRWRVAFCGAEPVRAQTLRGFAAATERFGFDPKRLLPCYGMAESTVYVSAASGTPQDLIARFDAHALQQNRAEHDDSGQELVACGYVQQPTISTIEIRNTANVTVGDGQIGGVHVKGPSVARGYIAPGQTDAVPFADDGWLPTGDLGFVHENRLFICGRIKDMVIRNGRNHAANDLEACAVAAVDAIEPGWTCLAFSFVRQDSHTSGKEQVAILAEPPRRSNACDNSAAISDAIIGALVAERGLVPDQVGFVRTGALPRTTSGKLRRAAARDAMLSGALKVTDATVKVKPARVQEPLDAHAHPVLRQVIADVLEVPQSTVDLTLSLASLGADSLKVLEIQSRLEQELDLHVPLEALLADLSINDLLSATPANETAMCHADATLPVDLVPSTAQRGDAMFLTGATGLVGRYVLVRALKAQDVPKIFVLTRSSARARLDAWITSNGLTRQAARKLQVLTGDLSLPQMGLNASDLERLQTEVGTIIHSAADLSFVLPYSALRASNVLAVSDMLTLMSKGCGKRLVALSSAGILEAPGQGGAVREQDDVPNPADLPLSYARTKWASDAMVRAAQHRGFDAVVLRPPWIVEDAPAGAHGQVTAADFLARFVQSCLHSATAPIGPFHWNVVDAGFVAEASMYAARHSGPPILHLGLPKPLTAQAFLAGLTQAGCSVVGQTAEDWLRELQSAVRKDPEHPLAPLQHLILASDAKDSAMWPYTQGQVPYMDSTQSLEYLAKADIFPNMPRLVPDMPSHPVSNLVHSDPMTS